MANKIRIRYLPGKVNPKSPITNTGFKTKPIGYFNSNKNLSGLYDAMKKT